MEKLSTKFKCHINQIPKRNYTETDYPYFQDNFCNQLFQTWAKLHLSVPKNPEEICEQPLWHNTHIKVNGRSF